MDHQGQHIANQVIASNFATYLIQNKLQTRRLQNGHTVQFVSVPMIANHVEVRARKYLPLIRKAAQRYGIDESLILGIMQTESSFNPYAISYANAIGLMQVVPHTAGRDVFAMKAKVDSHQRVIYMILRIILMLAYLICGFYKINI